VFRPAIVTTTLLAVFGSGQPVFAEEAIPEPRCVCGLSTDTDFLNAVHLTLSAPTPQTLPRHHRRSSAAKREIERQDGYRARTPWS
jgi:hypothetical protein